MPESGLAVVEYNPAADPAAHAEAARAARAMAADRSVIVMPVPGAEPLVTPFSDDAQAALLYLDARRRLCQRIDRLAEYQRQLRALGGMSWQATADVWASGGLPAGAPAPDASFRVAEFLEMAADCRRLYREAVRLWGRIPPENREGLREPPEGGPVRSHQWLRG